MPSDPESKVAAPTSPIKCIYWNVRSISGKKNVKHLQHYIKKKQVDLLFLSETWQRKGHPLPALPGYKLISCMSDNVGGRGGVACYFKEEHAAHIEIHKTDPQGHYLWLKLDKALGFDKDLFAAVCYFPPKASTAYNDRDRLEPSFPYTNLSNDIFSVAMKTDFFVVGDFNGRIGDTQAAEAHRHGMARQSADKKYNKFGVPLMDVCDKNDLIICNGVAQVWPNSGETTCRSRSVVDYLLAPVSRARYLVKDIEILPLEKKSDHNAMHFTLRRPRSPAGHEILEAPTTERNPSSDIGITEAVPKGPPSEVQVSDSKGSKSEQCESITSDRPPPPVLSAVEWTSRLLNKILAERFRKVEVDVTPGDLKRGYMTRSFDALTKQGPSGQHCKHPNPNSKNSLDARKLDGGATEYWSRKVEETCVSEPVFSLDKLMTVNSRPASVASPGLVHVARLSVRADTSCRGQRTDGSRMRTSTGSWGAKGLKMGPGFRCTCMYPGYRVKPGLQIDVAHPFMKRDSYTRSILVVQPSRFAALLNSLKQAYDTGKLWKSIAQFKLTRKLVKAIK